MLRYKFDSVYFDYGCVFCEDVLDYLHVFDCPVLIALLMQRLIIKTSLGLHYLFVLYKILVSNTHVMLSVFGVIVCMCSRCRTIF